MENSSAIKKRNKQQHAQNLKSIMLSKIIQIDKSIYSVIQFHEIQMQANLKQFYNYQNYVVVLESIGIVVWEIGY